MYELSSKDFQLSSASLVGEQYWWPPVLTHNLQVNTSLVYIWFINCDLEVTEFRLISDIWSVHLWYDFQSYVSSQAATLPTQQHHSISLWQLRCKTEEMISSLAAFLYVHQKLLRKQKPEKKKESPTLTLRSSWSLAHRRRRGRSHRALTSSCRFLSTLCLWRSRLAQSGTLMWSSGEHKRLMSKQSDWF